MAYMTLTKENIDSEHICCAFADKQCADSYQMKKKWLKAEFGNGYVFRRLDERGKVFIEYGPAEKAWVPVTAPNYLMLGCFWVSGKYKKQGHGKALLKQVVDVAQERGKKGLVTVVGTKKLNFMSDTKWLLRQGFECCEKVASGFSLLTMSFDRSGNVPCFNGSVKSGRCPVTKGLAVYYTNRCPYSEYHVKESLISTAKKRGLPLKIIKLNTLKEAQAAPSPATIFSLFLNGKFMTTDISVCMDSRFDKIISKCC